MEFLMQNPLILLAGILIVMALIVYVLVAKKPAKKKKETKIEDKNAGALSEQEVVPDSEENITETKTDSNEKKAKRKLKKLKPEIVRVYEKKQLQKKETKSENLSDSKEKEEEELLKKMQFVKTSKNISRLKPYILDEQNEELLEENLQSVDVNVDVNVDSFAEIEKSTHFDRTRRLSKMIKEDTFDDMFCSHISEKYMNMDALDKHIRSCDEIQNKLFERAAKTIAYSQSKVSISDDGKIQQSDNAKVKAMIEERRREELAKMMVDLNEENKFVSEDELIDNIHDEFDLSARNILIVDSILNRKGKKYVKK